MMRYDDMAEEVAKSKESSYQDKLTTYLQLYYDLNHYVDSRNDIPRVGDIYIDKEGRYMIISHLLLDNFFCLTSVHFDVNGNLDSETGNVSVNRKLESLTNGDYQYYGTYFDMINTPAKRIKIGLQMKKEDLRSESEYIDIMIGLTEEEYFDPNTYNYKLGRMMM